MTTKELNNILKECLIDERLFFVEAMDFEVRADEDSQDYLNLAEIDIENGDDLVKVIRYIAIALFLQRQE